MPSNRPLWTDDEVRELYRRYQEGLSCRALAAEVGVSTFPIVRHFRRLGLPRRPKSRPPRITDAWVEELHRRYMAGERSVDLADEVGVTRERIVQMFRERGLKRRPPGGVAGFRASPVPLRVADDHEHVSVEGKCVGCGEPATA